MGSERVAFGTGTNSSQLYSGTGPIYTCALSPFERSAPLLGFSEGTHVCVGVVSKTRQLSVLHKLTLGGPALTLAFSPKCLVYSKDLLE
jgi:hypothetical protein